MKIETDLSKNYFACFDEARGIAVHKKRILKARRNISYSYMLGKILVFIWLLIFALILSYICGRMCICCKLWILIPCIIIFDIIYLFVALFNAFSIYRFRSLRKFKNVIKFDKTGITDESYYGIKMIFKWSKIKGIVFGKYTVTVLTDTPVYFYFNIEDKYSVIEAVDKYASLDLIIK